MQPPNERWKMLIEQNLQHPDSLSHSRLAAITVIMPVVELGASTAGSENKRRH